MEETVPLPPFAERRGPAENRKVDRIVPEHNAFAFEQSPLARARTAAEGDHSPDIDDSLPGDIGSRREVVKRIAGKTGLATGVHEPPA